MAFNGAGAFVRTDGVRSGADVHAQQKTAGVNVRADLTDTELEDMATGMELAVLRDGQNAASANLPMGGFKHTGVTAASGGSSRTEYTSGGTVQDGAIWDAGDTGGTTTAFTATLSPAITAYANKQLFRVKFNAAFGANPTINFNSVGAKKMYYMVGSTATQLTTNNVPQNYVGILRYDASLDSSAGAFLLLNPPLELGTVSLTTAIGALDAETTIATDDLLPITDTSESDAANKMTVANFLKVVNALTEDVAPDEVLDFIPTYDASASGAKKVAVATIMYPRGHLAGLALSNNGSDATNDIDIAVGSARDGSDATGMVLTSALTKQLDAAWAVGTNQGGLDTGTIANTTYHVWLIKRSDTGVVDALFSTSASAPTMPANYDYKRRIGSIIRSGGAILAFDQFGDRFLLDTPVLDISATSIGTSAVTRTLASVPTGIVVIALLNVWVGNSTQADMVYLSALASADLAPSSSAAPLNNAYGNAANVGNSGRAEIPTNTSAQIRSRSNSANSQLLIATKGWIDRRGRDD